MAVINRVSLTTNSSVTGLGNRNYFTSITCVQLFLPHLSSGESALNILHCCHMCPAYSSFNSPSLMSRKHFAVLAITSCDKASQITKLLCTNAHELRWCLLQIFPPLQSSCYGEKIHGCIFPVNGKPVWFCQPSSRYSKVCGYIPSQA